MLFCRHYFSLLNTFMRQGKDPDPHLLQMDIKIRMAQKHADPADLNPVQNFLQNFLYQLVR
jgi:hypothetical protein